MQLRIGFWSALTLLCCSTSLFAQNKGDSVVVVYNKDLPDSKQLAEYYAQKRQVPAGQVLGFSLPTTESISRKDFAEKLQKPLWQELVARKLFVPFDKGAGEAQLKHVKESKIRYATLCFGVPLKITADPAIKEEIAEKLPQELRRNEAAVDSELALLPAFLAKFPIVGAVNNPVYASTNLSFLHPTNGVLMVARLDGPSVDLARGLVDRALQAENDGLWGRGYFDTRGLTNGPYLQGDEWIKAAAEIARLHGFETVVDHTPATFSPGFPMSQIALYFGWYDGQVSGPLAAPQPEFMPGAVVYHLHSFSAQTIRSRDANWVGPLVARGVTATMGCTEEPYLQGTPEVNNFLFRFLFAGFSFGEAACTSQRSLSWQTTVVGDPLYSPFSKTAQQQHEDLILKKSKLLEWSHLRIINRNMKHASFDQLTDYIEQTPEAQTSSVLQEKLGDLYESHAKFLFAIDPYLRALKLETTPLQRLRITLSAARVLNLFDRPEEAYNLYKNLIAEYPQYPDLKNVYRKLADIAEKLGKKDEAEDFRKKSS